MLLEDCHRWLNGNSIGMYEPKPGLTVGLFILMVRLEAQQCRVYPWFTRNYHIIRSQMWVNEFYTADSAGSNPFLLRCCCMLQ